MNTNQQDAIRRLMIQARCKSCGQLHPEMEGGYTLCCGENTISPGHPDYENAARASEESQNV